MRLARTAVAAVLAASCAAFFVPAACAASALPAPCVGTGAPLVPVPRPSPLSAPGVLDRVPVDSAPAPAVVSEMSPAGEELLAQRAIRDRNEQKKRVEEGKEAAQEPDEPRRPGKALLFSAVVPGTGQLSQGANRGYAYLGVEVLSWLAYFSFHSSGKEKETLFESYADDHWDLDRLKRAAAESTCTVLPDSTDLALIEEFRQTNQQHYYEDIGKLDTYACGWDNPANRQAYRQMRRESNRMLTNARRAETLAFVNHVASAVDAFLLARKYNRSLGQGIDMKIEMVADARNPRGRITFTRRFF